MPTLGMPHYSNLHMLSYSEDQNPSSLGFMDILLHRHNCQQAGWGNPARTVCPIVLLSLLPLGMGQDPSGVRILSQGISIRLALKQNGSIGGRRVSRTHFGEGIISQTVAKTKTCVSEYHYFLSIQRTPVWIHSVISLSKVISKNIIKLFIEKMIQIQVF